MSEIRYVKSKQIFTAIQYTGKNLDKVEEFCGDATLLKDDGKLRLFQKYVETINIGDWIVSRDGMLIVYPSEEMAESFEILPYLFTFQNIEEGHL